MNDFFLSVRQQSLSDHINIEPHSSIDSIIEKYNNHSSIKNIKRSLKDKARFDFQPISESCIKHILATLNFKKSYGHDAINTKFLKVSADIIANPYQTSLTNLSSKGSVLFP